MDVQLNTGNLTLATATDELMRFADQLADDFRSQVVAVIEQFVESEPTPQKTLDLENTLHDRFRELGRRTMAWAVNQLEPEIEQMPGTISHKGKSYRRLSEKTQRSNILTRFGKISLERARYRRGRAGRTIFPLEMLLGIEKGFTPSAADRVGKQFAACGSSQG